jgi:hypothetical protein
VADLFSRFLNRKKENAYPVTKIYSGLRNQVFDLAKQKLEMNGNKPLAILMETATTEHCYSLAVIADGTTSLYFSNGGGIIGAGEHQPVALAAKSFLGFSVSFENLLSTVTQYPLPAPGMTTFYVVKPGVISGGEFKETDLGYRKLPMSPLFFKGQEVITAIRLLNLPKKG